MATIPSERVPRQIARGAARLDLRSVRAVAGRDLRAVFGAIPNIKGITIAESPGELIWLDSLGAIGRLAPRPAGGRPARLMECAAQSIGEPALAGGQSGYLGDRRFAATRRAGLVRNRPT